MSGDTNSPPALMDAMTVSKDLSDEVDAQICCFPLWPTTFGILLFSTDKPVAYVLGKFVFLKSASIRSESHILSSY